MEEILSLLIGNQNQCCETCGHFCKYNKDWEIYWREKLSELEKKTKQKTIDNLNVGFLRQWLNEDRITDKEMVTNEDLISFIKPFN
jgi:hypothetical protein